MGRIPKELRRTIANNIRLCRLKSFPGHGGAKRCAEALGVSPQQWSPWERGYRTPDEMRLKQIADLFNVTVEYLRQHHSMEEVLYSNIGSMALSPPATTNHPRCSISPTEVLEEIVHITQSIEYALQNLGTLKKKLQSNHYDA
ncbi:MAG: helix-turn-helix transcriptional regulator [Planctomycetes bacterium]|nr:helix-turn-helix transcriptional regulator [Planctomycetota bacterium]MCC8116465.1 helix-turn-helix transcriptional regulator [Planctomycetota bacterium]MCD7897130.1 helix-turn-helix transcriptional regulator [Planctomycetaceae bacterium]